MVGERALAESKKEEEGTVSKNSSEKRGAPEKRLLKHLQYTL